MRRRLRGMGLVGVAALRVEEKKGRTEQHSFMKKLISLW